MQSACGSAALKALEPLGHGHQFVIYGDACSGQPGTRHALLFARINAVLRRLHPAPQFVVFPGDEIQGLSGGRDELMGQWRHFFDVELSWLDRSAMPMYHTTGNHTVYDALSEDVFRRVLDLPGNGPPAQRQLSYWVRRGDLLLIFVHTLAAELGGEGHVECAWLDEVLQAHGDARYRIVAGHHPVHPVNGFSGPCQREVAPEDAGPFWEVLTRHRVDAYVCSHMLAFDIQVHGGVLQLMTAGAGTEHRLPPEWEYLHLVQAAVDDQGLRYQVVDIDGVVREYLCWPPRWPCLTDPAWVRLSPGAQSGLFAGTPRDTGPVALQVELQVTGEGASAQTILSLYRPGEIGGLWLGVAGRGARLTCSLGPEAGRSPHLWLGPDLPRNEPLTLEVLLHPDMGPGGLLWRFPGGAWSSMRAASPWGLERLSWPTIWAVGHAQHGPADRAFQGALSVSCAASGPV